MSQRFTRSGYVYFVQAPINGLIKIGHTDREPMKRFGMLVAGSPVPLVHLGIMWGGLYLEKRLHRKFADLRDHGEWFRPGDRLVYMIRRWARLWTPDLLEHERLVTTYEEALERIAHLRQFGVDTSQPSKLRWFGAGRE